LLEIETTLLKLITRIIKVVLEHTTST